MHNGAARAARRQAMHIGAARATRRQAMHIGGIADRDAAGA